MRADLNVESGVCGAGLSPAQTISPSPSAASSQQAERGRGPRRCPQRAGNDLHGRRSAPRGRRPRLSSAPWTVQASGRHGSRSVAGGGAGVGPRSKSTVARSTPETPSTSEWWVLKINANRSSSSPSTSQLSHNGFARSSCWEAIREVSRKSWSLGSRRGERRVADVVLEVEARVIDPQRPSGLERRRRELLPVARHEVEPAADVIEVIAERGRRSVEHQHRADVHVRSRSLLMEE